MATFTRRLLPILFSGLLLVPLAGTVAAEDLPPPADDAALLQDGVDLVHMTNAKRESVGRVDLRMDPALMSIARDRARVMAANDVLSHTEPDGTTVWDRINAAHITWYGGGEIIAWNHYPAVYSTAEAISAWWGSPGHHAIMVSTGYNYVGFGAAVSADGKFYFAGVFAKLPDHTVPWARMGSVSDAHRRRTPQAGDRPLVGRRHPPAGPDLRSPLFPGPVARRRRQLARLDDEHRHEQVDHHGARRPLRGPRPGARSCRQLGRMADGQPPALTRAPAGDMPGRHPERAEARQLI